MFDNFVPRLREAMIDMLRIKRTFDDHADQGAHSQLVEAIAQRDTASARDLSRAHLMSLKNGMEAD